MSRDGPFCPLTYLNSPPPSTPLIRKGRGEQEEECGEEEDAELEHQRVGGAEAGSSSDKGSSMWHAAAGIMSSLASWANENSAFWIISTASCLIVNVSSSAVEGGGQLSGTVSPTVLLCSQIALKSEQEHKLLPSRHVHR